MRKLVTVVGARPQFVKAAVVSRALQGAGLEEVLIHTGQHFDASMSRIFFEQLGIPEPKYNLGIGGGSHAQNTGRSMEAIERLLQEESPDAVLVYGDTDSTLAGSVAASKLAVPIAHVEAGLRSFNRRMPEEINRVVTDHLSTVLFAPSQAAVDNLSREGIEGDKVRLVGDVMYDSVLLFTGVAERQCDPLSALGLTAEQYVLATLHRKENTDDARRLKHIVNGLGRSECTVVLPLHPRTRARIADLGLRLEAPIRVVEPVGYFEMLLLEKHARCIATDSGGVQKEAYFHRVPCITFRDETEWVELVELGVNELVGASEDRIAEALSRPAAGQQFGAIYGDGSSSVRIASILAEMDR